MGLPPEALVSTVAAYNTAVAEGATGSLSPSRTADRFPPMSIQRAPFRAVPVCAGITYTMGGIAIDGQTRVLDRNDAPIPGLYAAGAATGGLEGGPFTGYTGGLSKASVFGMLAAESIAREPDIRLKATA
jgi:fumarate reductase flavoprotein subunit